MKYTLLIHEPAHISDPNTPEVMAAHGAFYEALVAAGIFCGGAGLHPAPTATCLRVLNGQRVVQDGPWADTKEQLGGYYEIDVPNLDAALEWAARCPIAEGGGIEIRPQLTMPD